MKGGQRHGLLSLSDCRALPAVFLAASAAVSLLQLSDTAFTFPEFLLAARRSYEHNIEREEAEQVYLWSHYRPSDRVLSVGGNVGTTCTFVDKIVANPEGSVCVEPNPDTLPTLRENKRLHDAHFDIWPFLLGRPGGGNLSFSSMGIMAHIALPGERVDFTLPVVDKDLSAFDAVVLDCEGCFCLLAKQFPELLQVRVIINERDGTCDYDFPAFLYQHGFSRVDGTPWFVDGHPHHDVFTKESFVRHRAINSTFIQWCFTLRKKIGSVLGRRPPLQLVMMCHVAALVTGAYLAALAACRAGASGRWHGVGFNAVAPEDGKMT